ncbi:MAG: ABC transporter permease, partial [Actinomycetia bacterium]|nr:ABC transporter permease [Actinomycetes bacterium]
MKTAAVMLLRGLLHRWWLSCGIVALTLAAVVAAAIGPIYLSSSMTSLRVDRIDQQSNTNKSMSWSFVPTADAPWEQIRVDAAKATDERIDPTYYTDAQVAWLSKDQEGTRQGIPLQWNFEARESACEHLEVVHGRCPRRAGEMMVAAVDVDRGGFRVGSRVDLGVGHPVRVVGSYRLDDPTSAYWFDPVRYVSTPLQGSSSSPDSIPYTPAPFIVVADEVAALPASKRIVRVDRALQVPSDLDQATLERLADDANAEAGRDAIDVEGGRLGSADKTQLGAIRDDITGETDVATQTILPASLSLILVCVILQFRLISSAADLRRSEIALLKVRGWSGRRLRAMTLAEPLILLACGLVAGLLVAQPFGSYLNSMWLRPGTPTDFSAGALGMTLLVLGASIGATMIATRAVASESLRRQLEPTSAPVEPRRAIRVLRILVVVAAAVTVVVAMTGDPSAPSLVGQSMPAVVGLAAAVVATGLTVRVAR